MLGLLVWIGLKLCRLRNPYAEVTAWRIVLLAATVMPLLMQWTILTVPAPTADMISIGFDASPPSASSPVNWLFVAAIGYELVAVVLLLRLLWALWRTGRLCRAATLIHTRGATQVRITQSVGAPVTFGSVVLVPADFQRWSAFERHAALEHECTHIANRDFWFLLLARVNCAVFWLNPLAWWIAHRLSVLSEQISDDAAVGATHDRMAYADMLLSLARRSGVSGPVLSMARPAGVVSRIERLLSQATLAQRWSATRRTLFALPLLPLTLGVAGCEPENNTTALQQAAKPSAPDTQAPLSEGTRLANTVPPKRNPQFELSRPEYPPESRRARQTGTVRLNLYVRKDGTVEDVRIKESSGFEALDHAAATETLNWRLDPGTVEGKPTPMWGTFAVTFKLED